jgi:hypothetical protein
LHWEKELFPDAFNMADCEFSVIAGGHFSAIDGYNLFIRDIQIEQKNFCSSVLELWHSYVTL